jgi:hypothetical protein
MFYKSRTPRAGLPRDLAELKEDMKSWQGTWIGEEKGEKSKITF